MSLVMASWAVADLVESATLVAVTCTMGGEGKSAGAVKVPEVVMVPTEELPPATAFTLLVTAVFVVLATVAVKASEFPSKTEELDDEILTPQPSSAESKRESEGRCGKRDPFARARRGGCPLRSLRERPHAGRNAGEGPAKAVA